MSRHGGRGPGEHFNLLRRQFHPAGGPGFVPEHTGNHHRGLLGDFTQLHPRTDALEQAVSHTQLQKNQAPPHLSLGVDHAMDLNGPVSVAALHDVLPLQLSALPSSCQKFHTVHVLSNQICGPPEKQKVPKLHLAVSGRIIPRYHPKLPFLL